MIDFCLQCDDGTKMQYGKKDLIAKYKGSSVEVIGVHGWHCPVCGECYFDKGDGKRYSDALEKLRLSTKE